MKRDLGRRLQDMQESGELQRGRDFTASGKEKDRVIFGSDEWEEPTPFGLCYYGEKRFPLSYRHGKSTLDSLLACRGPALTLPTGNSALASFDPRQCLFLDTETTGLSGGTGTRVFLIGLGWLSDQHFILRQYFLRSPGEERALLAHFAQTVEPFSLLVTFNGKSFDLPLLHSRQVLCRMQEVSFPQHLDLLSCARVLWRERLPSRSLRSLEENLLGLQRVGDIPGEAIPHVYFDYLRRGCTRLITKVFEHNRLDILSMVTLLARIYSLSDGERVEHPAEALALGRLCLASGQEQMGQNQYRQAMESSTPTVSTRAALELANHFKRRGQWKEAIAIWRRTARDPAAGIPALIELAKYEEHRRRDFKTALEFTVQAMARGRSGWGRSGADDWQALEHRRRRLLRRLATREHQARHPGKAQSGDNLEI